MWPIGNDVSFDGGLSHQLLLLLNDNIEISMSSWDPTHEIHPKQTLPRQGAQRVGGEPWSLDRKCLYKAPVPSPGSSVLLLYVPETPEIVWYWRGE